MFAAGPLAVASVGNASAHAEQCGCGKNYRLHGLSPQIPWALAGLVWDLLHRTICDAGKMGFQLGGIIAAWGIGFMRTAKQHLPVRSNARIAGPMCRRCTRQRRKPSTHVGAPRALEDVCEFLGHRSDPETGKLAWPDMRREIRQGDVRPNVAPALPRVAGQMPRHKGDDDEHHHHQDGSSETSRPILAWLQFPR